MFINYIGDYEIMIKKKKCVWLNSAAQAKIPKYKSKIAFTLAEILITLTVVGVVSAITIPTLINKYKMIQFTTAKNKAYSELQQAYLKIFEETGSYPEEQCLLNDSECIGKLFADKMKTLSGSVWIPKNGFLKNCIEENIPEANKKEKHYCITTTDGMVFDFDMERAYGINDDRRNAFILLDVNGIKKPNKDNKDRYRIEIRNHKLQVVN